MDNDEDPDMYDDEEDMEDGYPEEEMFDDDDMDLVDEEEQ